jgi:hypothetical protein
MASGCTISQVEGDSRPADQNLYRSTQRLFLAAEDDRLLRDFCSPPGPYGNANAKINRVSSALLTTPMPLDFLDDAVV